VFEQWLWHHFLSTKHKTIIRRLNGKWRVNRTNGAGNTRAAAQGDYGDGSGESQIDIEEPTFNDGMEITQGNVDEQPVEDESAMRVEADIPNVEETVRVDSQSQVENSGIISLSL
jgi:hypothetical protein